MSYKKIKLLKKLIIDSGKSIKGYLSDIYINDKNEAIDKSNYSILILEKMSVNIAYTKYTELLKVLKFMRYKKYQIKVKSVIRLKLELENKVNELIKDFFNLRNFKSDIIKD